MKQACVLQENVHLSAMSLIVTIAAKEFKDNLRNRWLWMMTGILLLLSLSVGFMGSSISGSLVIFEPAQILSGLVTLSVFMLPLGAILLSYDSFVGEKESGTLLLLLTYPLARWYIVCGKLLGHASVLAVACILGFGITGFILGMLSEVHIRLSILIGFIHLISSGILLSLVFVLLGYWISLMVREKAKALGILLVLWFALVLIYDLVLLTALVGLADTLNRTLFNVLILLNPSDLFRALNLLAGQSETLAAKSSLALIAQTGIGLPLMYGLLMCWIGLLLLGCFWIFNHQDI
ncbi:MULTISPECIES: ABC transporter permease [Shewanella]|uniref:Copper ABC transporter, permease protein n=1 Tax=Shewanella putrefaciens (strain CN-32 / ATCC BAA-453) TaxID=319224 RepID=A4YAT6_SHEPC|nr:MULTISPECIES: ABC transporter permease subunit [Shewanella]ABM23435.1 copper ABC transporter, permease protein [Shewanella sp. W3-18-1]QGS48575.1 ABC transporter permease subunit [Shewanella putrefaciens]